MGRGEGSPETRGAVGCSVVLCVLLGGSIVGLSYHFTGSVNPLRVYAVGTTTQIVIVSILLTFLGVMVLGLVGMAVQGMIWDARGPDPRAQMGLGTVIGVALTLALSYWFSGSLNPLDVFRQGNVLQTVVVAVSLGLLAIVSMQLIFFASLIWRIESDTGKSFRDAYCKLCEHEVLAFSRGRWRMPMKCLHCEERVHFECWQRAGGTVVERCRDPKCQGDDRGSRLDDLFRVP